MKKFLCIVMCLTMFLVPMLTGCGETATDGEEAVADTEVVRYPMTLSLWLPTDENTTDEAIKLVETELNKLTTAKYDTAIELHAISADDYAKAIEDKLLSIDDVKKAQEKAKADAEKERVDNIHSGIVATDAVETEEVDDNGETTFEAETTVDEYGQSITIYPAVEDDQLDIFLVKGYDEYLNYIEEGLVQALDSEMSDIGKKLSSYIYPHFLDMADIDGLYGIPNNHQLGEYQFLLVNKRLVDEWSYSADELTTLTACEDFIRDMGALKASGNASLSGVTPLLGECEAANMIFFNGEGNFSLGAEPSLLCAQLTADTPYLLTAEELLPQRLFGSQYTKVLGMMKRLKASGYVGNGNIEDNSEFAVGVVSGNHTDIEKYEDDYYVYIHGVPVATEKDVFESVFCVSTYSKDVSRAMEIITYLNTDESMKTILQYGVEGTHWKADKTADGEDTIKIISNDYKMNNVDTGNVYLTYPAEGVAKSYWEHSMQQNIDCVLNPYFRFEYVSSDNEKNFATLKTLTNTYLQKLNALDGDSFNSSVTAMQKELIQNTTVSGLISKEATETVVDTLYMQLDMFLKSK